MTDMTDYVKSISIVAQGNWFLIFKSYSKHKKKATTIEGDMVIELI